MVVDPRAKMSKFVFGVSDMVVKECGTTILITKIDISRLMVHAQQIEEEKHREKSREAKRAKIGDGDFSHSSSDRHGCSKFGHRFSGQGSTNVLFPKFKNDRVSNLKP